MQIPNDDAAGLRTEHLRIPAKYGHFIYGLLQSGLTCLVAAGIASMPLLGHGHFLLHWLRSWMIAWVTMFPVVIVAAPVIQWTVNRMTTRPQA